MSEVIGRPAHPAAYTGEYRDAGDLLRTAGKKLRKFAENAMRLELASTSALASRSDTRPHRAFGSYSTRLLQDMHEHAQDDELRDRIAAELRWRGPHDRRASREPGQG